MLRSEIGILCEENAYNELKKAIEAAPDTKAPDRIYKNEENHILWWEDVIWFCTRMKETMYNAFSQFDSLENAGKYGYGYKFIRLGEEDGDIEVRSNCDFDFFCYYIGIHIPTGYIECDANGNEIPGETAGTPVYVLLEVRDQGDYTEPKYWDSALPAKEILLITTDSAKAEEALIRANNSAEDHVEYVIETHYQS